MPGIVGYVVLKHGVVGTGLAVLLCLLSSYASMVLLDRARHNAEDGRALWIGGAGAAGGFGIWATHFIAVLAYRPGVALSFRPGPTLLSLLIAILTTSAAISLAAGHGIARPPRRAASAGAAMIFGLGVAAMHFIGMSAMRMPGNMIWNGTLVGLSVGAGVALSLAAFLSARRRTDTPFRRLIPALLLGLAIAGLHFTAMSALTIQRLPMAMAAGRMRGPALSSLVLIALIGIGAVALLSIGLAAAFFARRAERAVRTSDLSFRLLVEGVRDYAIYMIDPHGRVSTWNAGAERLKGYTSAEVLGRDFGQFYSDDERQAGEPQRVLADARAGSVTRQGWHHRKDGTPFWASATIEPLRDAEGGLIGYAHITRDRTRQKEDADRLAQVTRNLDIALENMSQGLCLFGPDGRVILANGRCAELFSLNVHDIAPGMEYRAFLTRVYAALGWAGDPLRRRVDEVCDLQMAVIRQGRDGQFLLRLRDDRAVQATVRTTADGGWVETYEDITQRLEAEARIAYLAHHDGLTGLPNRAQFNDLLRRDLTMAGRAGQRLAVICIDLDKFKAINDQHGHATGDKVLGVLAGRIRAIQAEDELVARLGGDEFAAAKRFHDIAELHAFIGRLEACLSQPIVLEGLELRPDASLGVSLYPQDAGTVDTLMVNADLAMYRAKAALRERICFYQAEMDEAARGRRSLAAAVWEALDRKQFHLNFQVQKKVSTGEITGFEVLLRWRHPEWGLVPPMDFIPLAEECGAILPIGEWVLRAACRAAAGWSHPYTVAVNLSAVQLGDDGLADQVAAILAETGLAPHRLELEMTETAIVVDKAHSLRILRRIKAMGVSIAIDDFGVGYSSLETLRTFPFDKIKLDRSFMNEIEHSPESKAILRAILALGRSLNIPVLAEGVETRSQLDILDVEGCTEAQGYFLGRPGPVATDTVETPANA
ncbi:putative diguanylate cyclase [Gluconacetobacter johannae DSM 13595]|uniref:EAL domain-containing protein n=1 Tax=Gluconacetobacter johannae TaxID=112140 RepID=A0A7W4J7V1_9PROT|nr:EAL domain-containing protein [Gluconacetobacter johannae]MBB2176313.1 EAL domain-containing protein [Gluconacetobacter johannae]GBQ90463.1 putative diguanylate cyclase [Gluconacetobacter johannae DSM 13595]